MWVSLEILLPNQIFAQPLDFSSYELTVVVSSPPHSHREESSIWQTVFEEQCGTLFHLGDPQAIKVRQDRYYLYDVFDQDQTDALFIKFLPAYQFEFEQIVRKLCDVSTTGLIYVTTDVWLGPKSHAYKYVIPIDKFIKITAGRGIRKNSLRRVSSRP